MKKTIGLLLALLVMFSLPLALAEEVLTTQDSTSESPAETTADTTTESSIVEETTVIADTTEADVVIEQEVTADAGVTPDSALYTFDTLADDISLALTFDDAAKAELSLEIAEERLAESTQMVEENNTEAAAEAEAQHEEALTDAEESIEALESNGDNETSQDALETVTELQNAVEGHAAKVAAVKDAILAKKAAQGWDAEKLAKMTAVFDKIKAKAQQMEEKTEAKKEKVKTKYKALSGKTDAEVDAAVAEIDEKSGLQEAKEAKVKANVAEKTNAASSKEVKAEVKANVAGKVKTGTESTVTSSEELEEIAVTSNAVNENKGKSK